MDQKDQPKIQEGKSNSEPKITTKEAFNQAFRDKSINKNRILSIDGGGIKGLITLHILNHIEKNYLDQKKKEKLCDFFDCFAGTSTGSIIAAMLARGSSVQECIDLYQNNAEDIFPEYTKSNFFLWQYMKNAWYGLKFLAGKKYSNQKLKEQAEKIFKNTKMSDIKDKNLIITACELGTLSSTVFKSGRGDYQDMKVVDCVLASTAAPFYYPPHEVKIQGKPQFFVDGGVWANDPVLVAVSEYERDNEKYVALSVGNVTYTKGYEKITSSFWSLGISALIKTMFEAGQKSIYYYSAYLTQYPKQIYRLIVKDPLGPQFEMDNANKDSLTRMKKIADVYCKKMDEENLLQPAYSDKLKMK